MKETVVQMAKVNGVRWYRHVLRRNDGHVLRKVLEFEVKGKRKRERRGRCMWRRKARVLVWRRRLESESWRDAGLEIMTDTVANATKTLNLATKNSTLVATLATMFL